MTNLIKFLESNFGDLSKFPNQDLTVDECAFANDGMELKDVKVVGDDECFDGDEFYQYVLSDDKLYKAYFEIPTDDDGEELGLDDVDYTRSYKVEDITDDFC